MDELIERLRAEEGRRVAKWTTTPTQNPPMKYANREDVRALLRQAADALEAAREDAWVACSDRMPEREGLGAVLAFDADRPCKGVWLETTHPSWWGQFMEDANEWGPTITHWMPLPAPPKEARNG